MKRYRVIFEESAQQDVRESYDWGCRAWGKRKAQQWARQLRTAVLKRSESQRRLDAIQIGLGARCVRVGYVIGNEKATVRIVGHPSQDADSSRSRSTRFGKLLSPKIRLARVFASGHLTRSGGAGEGVSSSSSARMISTNLLRSRAGNALTCSTSSAVLMEQL